MAAAVLVGGGAFAAASLLGGDSDHGPQAAEALPADTFAYVGLDLSDAQDAIATLIKFPAIRDGLDLSSGDDPRQKIVESMLTDDNSCGLTWADDFEPWLGNRFGFAGVEVGDTPTPVGVVQVTDDSAAEKALEKFSSCDGDTDEGGFAVSDGWALIGENQSDIDQISDQAGDGTLADDSDFKSWTGEVGDQGIATAYAAPSAAKLLTKVIEEHPEMFEDGSSDFSGYDDYANPLAQICPGLDDPSASAQYYTDELKDFAGAAATLRFSDGGAELEAASDLGQTSSVTDEAGALVASLPDDTGAALGLSPGKGWFESALGSFGAVCGDGFDAGQIEDQLTSLTGIDFPEDIDTLFGDGLALSVSGDFDPSSITGPASIPAAIKIKGDPDAIKSVLDKISNRLGSTYGLLDTDSDSDNVVIGPSSSYRQSVLGDGGLGNNATFRNVVPDADKASAVLFINFNSFDKLVDSFGDSEASENFHVLDGLGVSTWLDGTTQHTFVRISTDD
ncbi:MAG: hypothetical protein QM638_18890 [Nocardioides sp.]|uniref:hypothetical protein n=1 Tax=Nocardioides sp. TaxID=35761 RepID=UPI0039E2B6F4